MADAKDKDPMSVWRDMLSKWETNVNALANKTMGTDEYSSSMSGAMGMTLRMQETVREFMATYLASTNLPSRTEVLAIAERLGGLEARLDRITALLERMAQPLPAAPTPAGTPAASADAPVVSARAPAARARPPRTKSPPRAEPAE